MYVFFISLIHGVDFVSTEGKQCIFLLYCSVGPLGLVFLKDSLYGGNGPNTKPCPNLRIIKPRRMTNMEYIL
jgi:hypothetical protein